MVHTFDLATGSCWATAWLCPPALGGLSLPRPALPSWRLPLGPTGWVGGALSSVGLGQAGLQAEKVGSTHGRPERPSQLLRALARGACHPPKAHFSWLSAPRSRGWWGCLAPVLQGVYFPQAPPQDRLSCPPSGLALVGAVGGLSGTPGRQGACMPR